ncbi:MAG: 16S rRNA (uracil(1498)-N(3))-methyltransferase [Chlamydiales bacterium]|nr:16S rRNA (uracil(1498)-N(3))-methyltransferase [Chlamydiales bacterium]
MPNNRFFTPYELKINQTIELEDKELHHLSHVTRCKVGELVEIVNGRGYLATGIIEVLSKKSASISITSTHFEERKKTRIILAQSIPLMNHLEMILEKGTELGVDEYYLFPSSKSSSLPNKEKLSRFDFILTSSIKQSGRLYLPSIKLYPSLQQVPIIHGNRFFGDVRENASYLQQAPLVDTILFIGPESGFTNDEVLYLESDYMAKGIKLSSNILRVETAAITGIGMLAMLLDV